MRRVAPLLLGAVILVGCQDQDSPTAPMQLEPSFAIHHAPTGGNPNFFWLPPIVNNSAATGPANMALSPTVRVCPAPAILDPMSAPPPCTPADALVEFSGAEITKASDQYHVNWHTKSTANLVVGRTYRVFVLVGGTVVGFIDVYIAENGKEARSAGGDVFGLVDGSAVPLRFRLQQGVLAGPDGCELDCAEFTTTDEAFEECSVNSWACLSASDNWLPEGFEGVEVTVVIERITPSAETAGKCFVGIPLPQGQGCYTVTTHPALGSAEFQAPVFWHMCQADDLPHGYEIHQQADNGEIRRPQQEPGTSQLDCGDFSVANSLIPDMLRRLARPVGRFLFGSPVHAADFFSSQIRSFSKFFYAPSVNLELVDEATVDGVKSATFQVTTDHGEDVGPVADVRVDFEVDGGSLNDTESSSDFAFSDANGLVSVAWTLPVVIEGSFVFTLTASIPVVVFPAEAKPTVEVAAFVDDGGEGEGDPFLLAAGLHYPKGMWIGSDGSVYITETGGRNTSFDSRNRVSRYAGGQLLTLLDEPVNSDAVVVTSLGVVYLASYNDVIPGNSGQVSRLTAGEGGLFEETVADLEIAVQDMFINSLDNIYVIGSSNDQEAKSLYLSGDDDYAVLASGLGRANALTIHQEDIYYANEAGVNLLLGEGSALILEQANIYGLTSDGESLYYANPLAGTIGRLHFNDDTEQWEDDTLMGGLNHPLKVRYDAQTGRLYFVEGGTSENQFQDGTLRYIQLPD